MTDVHKFSEEDFKYHLKEFNKVYYREEHRSDKLYTFPYWIHSYGYWLNREDTNRLPKHYRKFSQGTLVMVDFGTRIGSEMSLPHFAVVLSKKDTIFRKNIIVIPLSSKQHAGYLPLGNLLVEPVVKLINQRVTELERRNNGLVHVIKNFPRKSHFNIDDAGEEILQKNGIKNLEGTQEISDENYKSSPLYKFYTSLSNMDWKENESLTSAYTVLHDNFTGLDKMLTEYHAITKEQDELTKLAHKLNKYDKDSFADVQNVTSVSKLRVTKFSRYNISENITFNNETILKIKDRLQDFI